MIICHELSPLSDYRVIPVSGVDLRAAPNDKVQVRDGYVENSTASRLPPSAWPRQLQACYRLSDNVLEKIALQQAWKLEQMSQSL